MPNPASDVMNDLRPQTIDIEDGGPKMLTITIIFVTFVVGMLAAGRVGYGIATSSYEKSLADKCTKAQCFKYILEHEHGMYQKYNITIKPKGGR